MTRYSSDITAKVNTGEITTETAIKLLDKELSDLRNQDEEMTRERVKQAVIIKASVKENNNVERNEVNKFSICWRWICYRRFTNCCWCWDGWKCCRFDPWYTIDSSWCE